MQKIIFTLFLITILFVSTGIPQDKYCKKGHCLKGDVGYVSMSIGPSIPLGNFGDNNLNNSDAGFANTGSKVELNGGLNMVKSVDVAIKLFYSVNSYDFSSLTKKLSTDYPGTTWNTTGRSWEIYGVLIGVSYSHPLRDKFIGDFKFLSGFMKTSTPSMQITGSNGSSITENEKSATSFVYSLSAGGHYPLGRLIDFVGSLEYISSTPSFENVNTISSFPNKSITGTTTNSITNSMKQRISLLALNFGFRVKF